LRPIRTVAAIAAPFESLGKLLSSHRAFTRVSLAALSFIVIAAFSQQAATQAGPEPEPLVPASLLPQTVGIAVPTDASVTIPFGAAMDAASVESKLTLVPEQPFEAAWNESRTALTIAPDRRWRTDEQYVVMVSASALRGSGEPVGAVSRFAFTTETAPVVSDFQVHLATDAATAQATALSATADTSGAQSAGAVQPPTETATEVSATSSITVSFSDPMDRPDVEDRFAITPHVPGELTWRGGDLVFTPAGRLAAGNRYTISVIGAHDLTGNVIGGEANFSFIVQPGAQVTKSLPRYNQRDVEPPIVEMWFSQPMNVEATNAAFSLTDRSTEALVGGLLNWNEARTQLVYTPDRPFVGGRTFTVRLAKGAQDAHGNPLTVTWSFATKAAPVAAAAPPASATTTTRAAPAPRVVVPPAAPATSLAGYALNQVNAARAAYGFAPLVLDGAISAVASAHAWDQATNNYFSHYGLNGSTRDTRLRAGGVSYSVSGENQCYYVGMSQQATLDWCHAQFMAEPYPGHWNHIANILNPNFHRMGVGIATVSGRTIITWNFTD
jgi:uncharacterized protein YkwD